MQVKHTVPQLPAAGIEKTPWPTTFKRVYIFCASELTDRMKRPESTFHNMQVL